MISQKEFISESFPKMGFRHRILRRLYEYASRVKLAIMPFPFVDERVQHVEDFVFLMIFNKKTFIYAKATLYSFLKNSKDIPKLIVLVSDGTWNINEGEQFFSSFSNYNIRCESFQDSIDFFKNKGEVSLTRWAEKHIWGKKYAAITRYAENSLVLFSDPDVLWYSSPFSSDDFLQQEILKLSIDNSHNYDENLLEKLDLNILFDEIPINCGVVLMRGDVRMFHQISGVYDALDYEAEFAGSFAEQTIFAVEYLKYKNVWAENEISASISDMLQPYFKVNHYPLGFIARHYLFVLKWIYWKDFLMKI